MTQTKAKPRTTTKTKRLKEVKPALVSCDCCGEEFEETEVKNLEGFGYVCDLCKDEIRTCGYCEGKAHVDDMTPSISYGDVCESCMDNHFAHCEDCGEVFHVNDMRDVPWSGLYCDECFNESFTYCCHCDEPIARDDCYTSEDGDSLCEACYDNRDRDSGLFRREKNAPYQGAKNKFGVEIECYNNQGHEIYRSAPVVDFFDAVYDGSLGEDGIEYVSGILPHNRTGFKILRDFCGVLRKTKHTVDSTAGLHIHLSVGEKRKLTVLQLQKLLVGYIIAEPIFFKLVPDSRRHNSYCRRLSKDMDISDICAYGTALGLAGYYYETQLHNWNSRTFESKWSDKRYYYANFHSVFYRGSLEIRLHSGTINYQKIYNWLQLHRRFVDWMMSPKTRLKDVRSLNESMFFRIVGYNATKYAIDRMETFESDSNVAKDVLNEMLQERKVGGSKDVRTVNKC